MLTTLLLLPTSGEAEIAGYELGRDPDSIRTNIRIIFQDPSLDIRAYRNSYGFWKITTRIPGIFPSKKIRCEEIFHPGCQGKIINCLKPQEIFP